MLSRMLNRCVRHGASRRAFSSASKRATSLLVSDSRGCETLEVDIVPAGSTPLVSWARSSVPSGASTGIWEAPTRDVSDIVDNDIPSKLYDLVGDQPQPAFDRTMLNTAGTYELAEKTNTHEPTDSEFAKAAKREYGAQSTLGLSMAVCRDQAYQNGQSLVEYLRDLYITLSKEAGYTGVTKDSPYVFPVPAFNIINGGAHAQNDLEFQEFMILPTGAESFSQAFDWGRLVYQHLKTIIKSKYAGGGINVGDEGGFAPGVKSPQEALDLVMEAIDAAGVGMDNVKIGVDVAASEFYDRKKGYKNPNDPVRGDPVSGDALAEVYLDLCSYPIVSVEDPFDQDDVKSWSNLMKGKAELETPFQVVGDDLTVTNTDRMAMAVEENACDALLLKINQIGTISEAISAHVMARANNWNTMVSHRSGETEDTFIADLSVALNSGQLKTGAPCRGERTAKYNQLLRLEQQLTEAGKDVRYAGAQWNTGPQLDQK